MSRTDLLEAIRAALASLESYDLALFRLRAGEECITAKMAAYLDADNLIRSNRLRADAEYMSRVGIHRGYQELVVGEPEILIYRASTTGSSVHLGGGKIYLETITYPDVVIHCRQGYGNFAAFEVKLDAGLKRHAVAHDLRKLMAYRNDLGYEYGVFINLVYREAPIECLEAEVVLVEFCARNEVVLSPFDVPSTSPHVGFAGGKGLKFLEDVVRDVRGPLYRPPQKRRREIPDRDPSLSTSDAPIQPSLTGRSK